MKQFCIVISMLLIWGIVVPLSRENNPDVESITAAVYPEESELPDFDEMKVLKEYKVPETDITIRVVDNETLTTFGPGCVTIYKNDEEICDKWIGNDGGALYDFNVDIKSDGENVYVTLKGCEQEDETVTLPIK